VLVSTAMTLVMLFGSAMALAQDTSFRHKYLMRGQILDVEDKGLVVCVGTADGAEVGQELDVIRHKRIPTPPKSPLPRFRRETVGKVRITAVVDGHYAQAEVITGDVRVNDTVELQRK